MKSVAESYIADEVNSAVISVPACFNDSQRQATKYAGTIAGFSAVRIINEPTAAAITIVLAEKHSAETRRKLNVVIFDMGAGTLDVSLLYIDGSVIEVQATAGNAQLGGEDFNNRLVAHCAAEIQQKHQKDIYSNASELNRLREACEYAKCELSFADDSSIEIASLLDGVDFKSFITRARFEKLCDDLFKRTFSAVKTMLKYSNIDKNEIDDVVILGGCTLIPKIKGFLAEIFRGKNLRENFRFNKAVAFGVAVQAGFVSGYANDMTFKLQLSDVIPLTIRIEDFRGYMLLLFKRNTKIPSKITLMIASNASKLQLMSVQVFEGECETVKENNLLGNFELAGVPPTNKSIPFFELVTFEVDIDGILSLFVDSENTNTSSEQSNDNSTDESTDKSTSKSTITFKSEKGRLTNDQIKTMAQDIAKYSTETKNHKYLQRRA